VHLRKWEQHAETGLGKMFLFLANSCSGTIVSSGFILTHNIKKKNTVKGKEGKSI
jgi:hypothetical protein